MPSLYSLNSPPHPFWDFVASLDDGRSRPQPASHAEKDEHAGRSSETSSKTKASDKQPTVEDEVEAESSQEKGKAREATGATPCEGPSVPLRGSGPCGGDGSARGPQDGDGHGPCRGRRGRRGGRGGHAGWGESHHHHSPGEGFDGFGDFNSFGMRGPSLGNVGVFIPRRPCASAPSSGPTGTGPDPSHPSHSPYHHQQHRGRVPRGGPNNFNLGDFLSNLGTRLGLDLSGAAEGLGLATDGSVGGKTKLAEGFDFEPRTDIFDTPASYLIHLSLPGAQKEDLGVEWDGEKSTLHIGGVVHRPGIDEETLKLLAVDGRKKEVGVFEKEIHLGTKRDPANIDVAAITAKMTDGVLVVKVPKIEVEHKKRAVPITQSVSPSPAGEGEHEQQPSTIQPAERNDAPPVPDTVPEKAKEGAEEMDVDGARSETEKGDEIERDDRAEQLPEYEAPGRDDGPASEGEEGEYVKIDVD